mgnify:CR=1 FL=1
MEVKLYRPSNGTEGEMFISHWCGTCEHERERRENPDADGCEIVTWTMALPITDGQYPHEWQYGPNGPRCTAYCEDGTVAIIPIDHNAVVRPLL